MQPVSDIKERPGYVYVLTNPCIWYTYCDKNGEKKTISPVKIGITRQGLKPRLGALNTSLPENFVHHMSVYAPDPKAIENIVHKLLKEYRILTRDGNKTEFFRCSVKEAMDTLKETADDLHLKYEVDKSMFIGRHSKGMTVKGKKRAVATDKKVEERKAPPLAASAKREPFKFSMCKIKVGEKVAFVDDASKQAEVVDDRHVMYDGKKFSLTALAKRLLDTKWSLAGTLYFTYKGEVLDDLRKRLEQ